jgi:hypothetical protein
VIMLDVRTSLRMGGAPDVTASIICHGASDLQPEIGPIAACVKSGVQQALAPLHLTLPRYPKNTTAPFAPFELSARKTCAFKGSKPKGAAPFD